MSASTNVQARPSPVIWESGAVIPDSGVVTEADELITTESGQTIDVE